MDAVANVNGPTQLKSVAWKPMERQSRARLSQQSEGAKAMCAASAEAFERLHTPAR
jgi:hypothetical protein